MFLRYCLRVFIFIDWNGFKLFGGNEWLFVVSEVGLVCSERVVEGFFGRVVVDFGKSSLIFLVG